MLPFLLLVSRCSSFFYSLSLFKLALQGDLAGMLREQLELEDDEVGPLMMALKGLGVRRAEVSEQRVEVGVSALIRSDIPLFGVSVRTRAGDKKQQGIVVLEGLNSALTLATALVSECVNHVSDCARACACLLQHLSHLLSEDLQGLPLTRIQARMFASKFVSGAAQVFVHSCCTLDKTFDLVLGVYLFLI